MRVAVGLLAGLVLAAPLAAGAVVGGFAAEDEDVRASWRGGWVLVPGTIPNGWETYVATAGELCDEISPAMIAAQIEQESQWDPLAESPAGAQGLAQFIPATWAAYGTDGSGDGVADVWEPADAIISMGVYNCANAAVLAAADMTPTIELVLAAYNAGPGAVLAYGGVPPFEETHDYIAKILARIPYYGSVVGGTPVLAGYEPAPEICPAVPGPPWTHFLDFRLTAATVRLMGCTAHVWDWAIPTSTYRPPEQSGTNSYHPLGRALDVAPPGALSPPGNTTGWYMAHWYQVNADRLGIEYIIWDNWIWIRGGPWRAYHHPCFTNPSLNHEDHVHISLYAGDGVPDAPLLDHAPYDGTSCVPFRTADEVLEP